LNLAVSQYVTVNALAILEGVLVEANFGVKEVNTLLKAQIVRSSKRIA
jgi:hypothetical protein